MNMFKTTMLLALLSGILIAIGGATGGRSGLILALALAAGMNFFAYWFSDRFVLRMYRAIPMSRDQSPVLYDILERLTSRANIPMPRVYLLPMDAPNAFATGRDPQHAAVAVTHGILKLLNPEELEGVLAHELAHVRNRDVLISSVAATLGAAIMVLARLTMFAELFGGGGDDRGGRGSNPLALLATMILAPVAALMIQLAVSRSREFQADASGAELARSPHGLASALQKLEEYGKRIPMPASPATSHMFIMRPLSRELLAGLFRTHPPTRERVRRLLGR
ncbi:MAG: zinc metalloprotease HtpX [Acidobacteriota bacterium]